MAKSRTRGRFVVFEGIDGSGTTTQASRCADWLRSAGHGVHPTREPTGGPIGTMIRQVLAGRMVSRGTKGEEPVDPATIALLFAADRLDHIQNEINPRLAAGDVVLCDRYVLSSLAYQAVEVDLRFVRAINEHAIAPDLTIFLRVRPETAMDRIAATRNSRDVFETLAFQRKVAARYDELITEYRGGRVVEIDGEQDRSRVTGQVRAAIDELL